MAFFYQSSRRRTALLHKHTTYCSGQSPEGAHNAPMAASFIHTLRLKIRIRRRRQDACHQFSRRIVNTYQNIVVGDVSSLKLVKTRMAKAVLDTGWGTLKQMLLYKGEHAGRSVRVVDERNTTRGCSNCRALSGPSGLRHLAVRTWVCVQCGVLHDRDVNSARNIRASGSRCGTSVSGNESSPEERAPSQTLSLREAGSHALRAAA